jgi:hypothetical protein
MKAAILAAVLLAGCVTLQRQDTGTCQVDCPFGISLSYTWTF